MNEQFSPEQSLQVIQTMIDKTRRSFSDKSHYFLLWGWTTMLAFLGQFVLISVFNAARHYYIWWITIVAAIVTMVLMLKERKEEKVTTYVTESMGHLWIGMGISFFVVSLIFIKIGWNYCYPFFIMLYGLGTFISGRILQFTPLVAGGIINWILAIAAVWFDVEYQMLFAAFALLVSYVIPGHLLAAKYRHLREKC